MSRPLAAWTTALGLLALCACAGPAEPEAEIRALLSDVQRAVNERDVRGVEAHLSPQYRDEAGHDARDVGRLLRAQMLRRGRSFVWLRERELEIHAPRRARAEVLAAMTRVPVDDPSDLARLRADAWIFELEFADEGSEGWRVRSARWRPAHADDLAW